MSFPQLDETNMGRRMFFIAHRVSKSPREVTSHISQSIVDKPWQPPLGITMAFINVAFAALWCISDHIIVEMASKG